MSRNPVKKGAGLLREAGKHLLDAVKESDKEKRADVMKGLVSGLSHKKLPEDVGLVYEAAYHAGRRSKYGAALFVAGVLVGLSL